MKIKEFTYTKADGSTSERTIVELVSPSQHVEGIDITELDMDSFAEFVKQLNELERTIYDMRIKLYSEFDLTHNYRKFVPERMTDVTTEYA